jgi:tRNA1Val (adenine37-N6)-methyltransferase
VKEKSYSVDSIWADSIQIEQSRNGYRFSVDAVLLAHFLQLNGSEKVLEIGCGNGIILVLLSRLKKYKHITGVEIQHELAELACKNVESNKAKRIEIIEADIRELKNKFPKKAFDLIYSNPPYRKIGTGRLNPSPEKAIARHEVNLKLEDLILVANELLKDDGFLSVILPSFREKDWMKLIEARSYFVHTRQYVHSFPKSPAAFVLCTAGRKNAPIEDLPPLTIYESRGKYTPAMSALLTNDLSQRRKEF